MSSQTNITIEEENNKEEENIKTKKLLDKEKK